MSDQQHSGADEPVRPATSADLSGGETAAAAADGDAVKRERDEYYDLLLRKTAEFDNYRRRVERERRELSEYANAELLRDLLPLVDDLERALASTPADAPGSATALRSGVELILRQLLDVLKKRGVTTIDAKGADFDPHIHESVTQEVSADHREGEVLEEFRRGYKIGDRLLRPAMVKVATRG